MINMLGSTESNSPAKPNKKDEKTIIQHIDYVHTKGLTTLLTTLFFLIKYVPLKLVALYMKLFGKKKHLTHFQFNQRKFEQSTEELELTQKDVGFTNRVLVQNGSKTINFYLPVFITNKIKSIQDVSVEALTGNVSCAMIINVFYGDLPDQIVEYLSQNMVIQLNRGQAIKLENDLTISVKNDKKNRFLIFTIRKVFLAMLVQDNFWSPFELIELVISLTLNTVTVPPKNKTKHQNKQKSQSIGKSQQKQTGYDPTKQYKVSFNCMRNSDPIPMSYALDCVFGIYDLAQKKLQSYHSQYSTYSQILRAYDDRLNKDNKQKDNKKKKTKLNEDGSPLSGDQLIRFVRQFGFKIKMRQCKQKQIKDMPKVKYFQYTHFVIPLYKYPGNFIATIFIPIFILALVSLTIFFQDPDLSGRIGAIATMVLGYIALIPSIKERLPPSSNITIIECVVYIETICCLLCLLQSFMVRNTEGQQYIFIWHQSLYFITCLCIHIATFFFIMGLFLVHKLVWQPGYNSKTKVKEVKPSQNSQQWDNPYCDETFIKHNALINKNQKYEAKQKEENRIVEYHNPIKQNQANKQKQNKIKDKSAIQKKESEVDIDESSHFISRNSLNSNTTILSDSDILMKNDSQMLERPFQSQCIELKIEEKLKNI